ncbi:hypothetical protein NC653_025651 [Populus alba x Populus x berolinensis]|uniref:Uncharacterized protein n=1 Tax=Populus alba x Populus x berolinensis TaxID=444605 RepID=A0AAD6MBR2_9ROSI|nr:hypothetical protein NC653_025651 [Populus alba x Populus x berolinensis]
MFLEHSRLQGQGIEKGRSSVIDSALSMEVGVFFIDGAGLSVGVKVLLTREAAAATSLDILPDSEIKPVNPSLFLSGWVIEVSGPMLIFFCSGMLDAFNDVMAEAAAATATACSVLLES